MVSLFPSSVFKKEKGEVLDEVQTQLVNIKHLSYAMATPACPCRELLGLLPFASGCPDASQLSLSSMEKWPYVPGVTEQKAMWMS